MTKIVELDVAQATLSELIVGLESDEEVVIVRNHQPVTRILSSKKGNFNSAAAKGC